MRYTPTSCDLRAHLDAILSITFHRRAFRPCMHPGALPARARRHYVLHAYTYHVGAHYAWTRTFRPTYGRE